MNTNNIKNSTDSLNKTIKHLVEESINDIPVSLPVKVTARNKLTVDVETLIQFNELGYQTLKNIPIIKSRYFHYPVKENDFGLLIPISFFYASIVKETKTAIDTKSKTSFMGNYIFLPISQMDTDLSTDDFIDYSGASSPEGNSNINIFDDYIEFSGPDETTIKIESNNITVSKSETDLIIITDSEITIQNSGGFSIILNSSGIEINGNTDFAVKHTLLNTALQTELTLINAEYTKLTTTISQMVTAFAALGVTITPYTQGVVTLDISGAKDSEVKL